MRVVGGQWQGVTIRGGNLSKLDLHRPRPARGRPVPRRPQSGTSLRDARLDGATLRDTDLDDADLRGASLDRVDLSAARLRRTKLDLAGAVLLAELHGADVDVALPG